MNDRFKFRVFCKDAMYFVLSLGEQHIVVTPSLVVTSARTLNTKDCILMQCTGLKDKNEKLIYEGDIVEILKFGYTNYIQKIMIVKWYQNQSSFRLFDIEALGATPQKLIEKRAMGAIDTMEVIGNIYENKDLVKE